MASTKTKRPSAIRTFFHGFGVALGTVLLVLMISFTIFACIFTAYLKNYLMPQVTFSLDGYNPNETSMILYKDSDTNNYEQLQALYGSENRIWASSSEIPSYMKYAAVAIEDKRFYTHGGVDWFRTMRASVNLFMGSGSTYGASTLTQQLIKNLTSDDEITVRRKLIEIFRALELEQEYSKDEILEWYLNTIYLGEQAYGVQSASYTYFGKSVEELDLAECASIIAITNNPSRYDPYISEKTKEANKERQETILYEMLDQGYINQNEYDHACAETLVFEYADSSEAVDSNSYYSYFVDQVIRDVVSDWCDQTGLESEVVYQMLFNGGYQIYSTIDVDVQQAAEDVYENLDNIPDTEKTYQQLQSGIVIIDNETGDISAIVGGVGEKSGSLVFSRATQSLLQPGSTIKPLAVYGPALDAGLITPATVVDDTPFTFGSSPWPSNESGTYAGLTNILTAMKNSTNTVAVKVLDELGLDYAYSYAYNSMGLDTLVDDYESGGVSYTDKSYWSLALGGTVQGVTVRDMAAAYASIENSGVYRTARTYTKVVDSEGNVVLDNTQSSRTVLSEKSAYYLTYMMEETVKDGTGTEAQLSSMAVAGKTGTTSDDQDRWFIGYTPYYTAAVWCGYDTPQEIVMADSSVDNPAAVLWNEVMTEVHSGLEERSFTTPSDIIEVEVCADSGLLATEWCCKDLRGDRTITVKLASEDVPTEYCSLHVGTDMCLTDGIYRLANENCAALGGNVAKYGMLNYSRLFPVSGIVVEDQQYCLNYYVPKTGYYEPRCNTMTPANETCTVHVVEKKTTSETYNPVVTLPTEQ